MAARRALTVDSVAKINLGIEVLGRRPDRYHEIRTLFQSVDFSDRLEFRLTAADGIVLKGNDAAVPWDQTNLIFRAAAHLKKSFPRAGGVEIRVIKNVPPGRGLGGGSSNAAMTIHALNVLWELGLSPGELKVRAASLGADVPYFLEGGLCLGEGRGDVVTALPDLPRLYCVLALPDFPVWTADIYARLPLTSTDKDSKMSQFLTRREFGRLENQLEKTILSLYPRLQAIKGFFLERDAVLSLVSGSGSAVYGLFEERAAAAKAVADWRGTERTLLVETLSRERYWKRVTAGV